MLAWLKEEPEKIEDIVRLCLYTIVCIALAQGFVTGVIHIFSLHDIPGDSTEKLMLKHKTDWQLFTLILLVAGPIEELAFRGIPLCVTGLLSKNNGTAFFICTMISSTLFGWIHGGAAFIPVQGVMGVCLSVLYLKCGGLRGTFLKPLLISSATHVSINLILVTGFLLSVPRL